MALPEGANSEFERWQTNVAEPPLPPPIAFRLNSSAASANAILIHPNGNEVDLTQEMYHEDRNQYDARVATWRNQWE